MPDFVIKRNDLLPVITGTCQGADGIGVSLAGATVKFIMKPGLNGTAKISASATPDPDQTTNPGKVTYTWTGTDTDTVGHFDAEWEVTFASGKKETFPSASYLTIQVKADLG